MNTTALYPRFEAWLQSVREYEDPAQEVAVNVEFEREGARGARSAFRDGERTWRVGCLPTGDSGFHNQSGSL